MANVNPGQYIRASDINDKVSKDELVIFGRAVDEQIADVKNYTIFVGNDYEWYSLPSTERNRYIMRGVPR